MRAFIKRWVGRERNVQGLGPTHADRLLLQRLAAGVTALMLAGAALILLGGTDWQGVLAGALLGWSVSILAWALSSYRSRRNEVQENLRHKAEYDTVHARLNQIATRVGAPTVELNVELEAAIQFRLSRRAHLMGFDEYGPYDDSGVAFWDNDAMGD